MNQKCLKVLLIASAWLCLTSASDLNTKYDLKYIIESEEKSI